MVSDKELEKEIKAVYSGGDINQDVVRMALGELKEYREREEKIAKIFQERAAREVEIQRNRSIQDNIIAAVLAERRRQDEKWGEQNHHPQFWTGILGEEHGELCQAINETVFDNGKEERKKGGYANMREEAIHVAAVAVGFLECLERNKDSREADELSKAAAPLIELMQRKYNPHHKIIVTLGGIEVMSGEMGVPAEVQG